MDLVKLLGRLQSIAVGGIASDAVTEAEEKADKDYDHDGKIESPEQEHAGAVDNAIKKSKANEDIANVLRSLKAIQEGEVEEGNKFSGELEKAKAQGKEEFEVDGKKYKVNESKCPECGHDPCDCDDHDHKDEKLDECGDMEMSPLTITDITGGEENQLASIPQMEPEQPAMQQEPAVEEAPKATYTLSIQNGENNLQMTTDVPDEIIHIMKLAGIQGKAEVKQQSPAADDEGQEQGEQEVDEAWANTPAATNERDPKPYGDIRDWAMKGTGKGQAGSAANKPFGSGDNPLSETTMMNEYKSFKAGK